MLSSVEILILSLVQGMSEFIPVSSAAHLVLVSKYYAFVNQNLLVDICLHLGSLLALILYFRDDLFNFITNRNFLLKILISTIPIIPVGYILLKTGSIDFLSSLEVIAWMSLIFGLLLFVSDKSKTTNNIETNFTIKSAIIIGILSSYWFSDNLLGIVIAMAMILNLVIAGMSGILIPITLNKFNIDPALASGVILTTITDVFGFLSFLGLASILLV